MAHRMPKFLFLVTVLVLAGALVFATGQKEGEAERVSLTVAGRDGSYGNAMQLAADAYMEQNANANVEVLKLPYDSLVEKTVVDLRSGAGTYDMILIDDPVAPRFMRAGWLANLEELYEQNDATLDDDLISNIVNLGRHPYPDGTLYALPHVGNVELFAYRHDILEQYGFSELSKWDQVMDAAQQISNNQPDTVPVLFRGTKGNPIVTGFLPIYWSFGADILQDGEPAFTTSAARNALNFFLDLAQYAPEGVASYNSAQVRDALYSGRGAIAIEVWPGWIGDLNNPEESQVVDQVTVTNHPGQVEPTSPLVGVWLVGIPDGSENKNAAFDFMRFVTSSDMQTQIARETGIPPTRESVHKVEELQEQYFWYDAQLRGLQNGVPRPRTGNWSEIEQVFGTNLQRALIGEISARQALQETQEQVQDIMAED